jgi:hypothetical protein
MTTKEFQDAVTPFLDPRAFEPFVIVGGDSPLVQIDHPSELELDDPVRWKRRRSLEARQIDPSSVTSIERLDKYGGWVGRRYSQFRSTLTTLLNAKPFIPFVVEFEYERKVRRVRIDRPEGLALSGRFALVVGSGQPLVTFSDADVVRITPEEVPTNAS